MKNKRKKRLLLILSLAVFIFSLGFASTTHADTNTITPPTFNTDSSSSDTTVPTPSLDPSSENYAGDVGGDTKKSLENWADELEVVSPLSSIFRGFGWWVIIQGGAIVNSINGATQNVYGLLNIYGSDSNVGPLQQTINDYLPIFIAIGILVFVAMTLGIMFSKNSNITTMLKSLLLSISIMVYLPFIFGQVSTITTAFAKSVTSSSNSGYSVIDQNVTDLYAVDKNLLWVKTDNASLDTKEKTQNFFANPSSKTLKYIDVNESLDSSKLTSEGKKIAESALVSDEKGNVKVKSLNDAQGNNWFKSLLTGDSAYYRYHVNFFTIIFYILLVLIISVFLLYKLVKIIISLVTTTSILQATAMTDTKGKRNWELLSKIFAGFGAIVMVIFLEVIFAKGYAVTSTLKGGAVVQAIAGIALAFAVIEGPNVFQSTFGVDANLGHGMRDIMSLGQGGMMMRSGFNMGASAVKGAVGAGKGVATSVANSANKAMGSANDIKDKMAKEGAGLANQLGNNSELNANTAENANQNQNNATDLNQQDNTDLKQHDDNYSPINSTDENTNSELSQMNASSEPVSAPTEQPLNETGNNFIDNSVDTNGTAQLANENKGMAQMANTPNMATGKGSLNTSTSPTNKALNGSKTAQKSNPVLASEPNLGKANAQAPHSSQVTNPRTIGSSVRNLNTNSAIQSPIISNNGSNHISIPNTPIISEPKKSRFSLNNIQPKIDNDMKG